MYVCLCSEVTDHQICAAVAAGATSVGDLGDSLGVARCCGSCEWHAREVLEQALATDAAAVGLAHDAAA